MTYFCLFRYVKHRDSTSDRDGGCGCVELNSFLFGDLATDQSEYALGKAHSHLTSAARGIVKILIDDHL